MSVSALSQQLQLQLQAAHNIQQLVLHNRKRRNTRTACNGTCRCSSLASITSAALLNCSDAVT
jgi:hypothetical protein